MLALMKKALRVLPPQAPKHPRTFRNHGDVRVDPYFWLRDLKNPNTMPYLKAENEYFQQQMRPLQKLKNQLFKEMKVRIKENESSVPAANGNYLYSSRYKKGLQYAQYVRKHKAGGREHVYLDGNELAKGHKYFELRTINVSAYENLVAFATDFDGSERFTIRFKNLQSGRVLPDRLQNSAGSCAWAQDNQTFFYVVLDKNLRPYRVYRHVLGQKQKQDELVFEEKDSQFFVDVHQSLSREFIYIHTGGKITDEVWFLRASDPLGRFQCIEKRREGLEYQVTDRYGQFWINTNWRARNFQIVKTPVHSPQRKNWETIVAGSAEILREGITAFANHLVVSERFAGLPQIRVVDLRNRRSHIVEFADPAFEVSVSTNDEFYADSVRLSYSSPITPNSELQYDFNRQTIKVLKTKEVKGHNSKNYVCQRKWVRSHDGVKVPLTLVFKKGLKPNSSAPGYLYGYGSYGYSMPDSFSLRRDVFRLIDRGFVYALAHPRGGSEMGRQWYEDGKFLKKKNTFLDFIACGDFLVESGWVAKGKLAACGGSAGGMLMGACVNLRPDLFGVVAAHVPFVDVINTMLDKNLPLTQTEYKEWGNPHQKKFYRYMKSYSPYDNVVAQDYPSLFVTCGLNDPRVTYWEPAKWTAKLRELKTDKNLLVFKTNMGAGHFGASGRFEHLWEHAEEFAFILRQFQMDGVKSRS